MSFSARKASSVVVAASIASVEALKDQGFARWNYPIRLASQHLQARVGSYLARPKKTEEATWTCRRKEETARRMERNHMKVMQLGCLGPQSIRF